MRDAVLPPEESVRDIGRVGEIGGGQSRAWLKIPAAAGALVRQDRQRLEQRPHLIGIDQAVNRDGDLVPASAGFCRCRFIMRVQNAEAPSNSPCATGP